MLELVNSCAAAVSVEGTQKLCSRYEAQGSVPPACKGSFQDVQIHKCVKCINLFVLRDQSCRANSSDRRPVVRHRLIKYSTTGSMPLAMFARGPPIGTRSPRTATPRCMGAADATLRQFFAVLCIYRTRVTNRTPGQCLNPWALAPSVPGAGIGVRWEVLHTGDFEKKKGMVNKDRHGCNEVLQTNCRRSFALSGKRTELEYPPGFVQIKTRACFF